LLRKYLLKLNSITADKCRAYETLSDEDRRRQYDNETVNTFGRKAYGFEKDPFDEFKDDVYKDKSRVYHETYSTGTTRRKKGEDIVKQVTISFLESVKGTKITLEF
jgi:DnaJ-class molecular chaperone